MCIRDRVIGVPPSYPPRRVNGVNVGCFMTPDTKTHDYTYPASVRQEIDRLVGAVSYTHLDVYKRQIQWKR